jgi:transposase-like protein
MPTVPRRPAAQQERGRLEGRRLRAAELFAAGVTQAEVARQLKLSAQAVSVWHARWQEGGTDALRSKGPSVPVPRLSDAQLARVEQALLEGAGANGFVGGAVDPGAGRYGDRAPHRRAASSGACVGAAAPPTGLERATPGPPGGRT